MVGIEPRSIGLETLSIPQMCNGVRSVFLSWEGVNKNSRGS